MEYTCAFLNTSTSIFILVRIGITITIDDGYSISFSRLRFAFQLSRAPSLSKEILAQNIASTSRLTYPDFGVSETRWKIHFKKKNRRSDYSEMLDRYRWRTLARSCYQNVKTWANLNDICNYTYIYTYTRILSVGVVGVLKSNLRFHGRFIYPAVGLENFEFPPYVFLFELSRIQVLVI